MISGHRCTHHQSHAATVFIEAFYFWKSTSFLETPASVPAKYIKGKILIVNRREKFPLIHVFRHLDFCKHKNLQFGSKKVIKKSIYQLGVSFIKNKHERVGLTCQRSYPLPVNTVIYYKRTVGVDQTRLPKCYRL